MPPSAGYVEVRRASLYPTVLDPDSTTYRGAAYANTGAIVIESLRPAQLGHWMPIDPVTQRPEPLPASPAAIYGGHLFLVWGHFLFETLSTAYSTHDLPLYPVVFAPFGHNRHAPAFASRLQSCMPLLMAAGWGNRKIQLHLEAQQFDCLIVPERLTVFASAARPEMLDIYNRIRARLAGNEAAEDVLIARRPKEHSRAHPAEEAFYAAMEDRGARIVDGASLSPVEQVRMFARASVLIGFAGSNLHNSVFCLPATPVIEIGDSRSHKGGRMAANATQALLCRIMSQPHHLIAGFDSENVPVSSDLLVQQVTAAR
jgi:capsular polysaccharide biosynthesis protein